MGAAPADRVLVSGLRLRGRHGWLPEERASPQPIEVDLVVEADLARPGRTDELVDTVDYAVLVEEAAAVVEGCSFRLLEALAQAIAQRVLERYAGRLSSVTVSVRKLKPPIRADLDHVGVTLTRGPA